MNFDILFEDNHLLVVSKPPGLLVQGDRSGDISLLEEARTYLKEKYSKPGNVYLGLVHRLDRNVSGVVVLARTSKAASRLAASFRDNAVEKTYLAVTQGIPDPGEAQLKAWLAGKSDARGVTRAASKAFPGGRESVLGYRVLEQNEAGALVEVKPVTGRRHQIRAQLALIGCPLLGDLKYGAASGLPDYRIALHARQLVIPHPVGGARRTFAVDPPGGWPWP